MALSTDDGYQQLLATISDTYTQGQTRAAQAVKAQLVETHWQLGRHIVDFEQAGQVRAEYGKALVDKLAADLQHEPQVFEFLKIPEPHQVSETQLETLLCDHLQPFLLELGKGFTFVGRQYRINVGGTHYRVDLVFYHRILRRFVLIDLKLGEVQHHDIGQMNLYLGYFAAEENTEGDQPPVGIILSRQKDELLVEYATYGMNSQLFVQQYQLYLPDREALRAELERVMWEAGQ